MAEKPKLPEQARKTEIKGCAEYGMGVELIRLRQRLNKGRVSEQERTEIEERIREIESVLEV